MKKRHILSLLLLAFSTQLSWGTLRNPMMWADCPDPDVIRVGDTYYMVTTTMHLMPGAPIMRSKDFTRWETVSYLFDKLTDSPRYEMKGGTAYGRGQWATSLRYHNGRFYALFSTNDDVNADTYIMTAEKAEGPWTIHSRLPHFHDAALFFDDDNRVYVCYGTGDIVELSADMKSVVPGSRRKTFERDATERGLLEGSRMIKHGGKYYLLMISWPPGGIRRQVCYRADRIDGPYEKKVILESPFGGFGGGVAQGTIVDDGKGGWNGIFFQDRGGVGRVPMLVPCRWVDGWPVLGDQNGQVPQTMPTGGSELKGNPTVTSDDFSAPDLAMQWQWNHNPMDEAWSLTERKGWLRLKANQAPNLYLARNTISQRMEGPRCSASARIDISKMKDGDRAGMAAFNGHSGILTIARDGKRLTLAQTATQVHLSDREKAVTKVDEETIEVIDIKGKHIELRIDADFTPGQDMATFYYRTKGKEWTPIGRPYRMRFDYRLFFMGTRYAIFNYATKEKGGHIDVDHFNYTKENH